MHMCRVMIRLPGTHTKTKRSWPSLYEGLLLLAVLFLYLFSFLLPPLYMYTYRC